MSSRVSAISVLRNRDFALYILNLLAGSFAAEILVVSIAWQVYAISNNPADLGLLGLVQFLPNCLLVLATGAAADRFPRKKILALCMVAEVVCIGAILLVTDAALHQVWPILCLVAGLSVGRAFYAPAALALAPTLVARAQIPAAISCGTISWQLASIAGPALGGGLYTLSPNAAFGTALAMAGAALLAVLAIRKQEDPVPPQADRLGALTGGFRFMLKQKVVLGAASLDLFAVLLGSVPGLMPALVKDVLHQDAFTMGLLRTGMGVGALSMALWLGLFPIRRKAGAIMFATVFVFGLGTVALGLSHWIGISIAALIVMGASDMISVYIREVLVQLWTPDSLRGRVNAVYMMMISASNELGAARAGFSAWAIGPAAAVVVGGGCILAVSAIWLRLFPGLRQTDDLNLVQALEPDARDAPAVTP